MLLRREPTFDGPWFFGLTGSFLQRSIIAFMSDSSSKLPSNRDERPDRLMTSPPTLFLYVKIPIVADLVDQVGQRADKIDQILRETGIGSVIGWGDSLGEKQPNGSRIAAFHRIDIEVTDRPATRLALQTALPVLDVPFGTEIHYTIERKAFMDLYSIAGWIVEQPISVPLKR